MTGSVQPSLFPDTPLSIESSRSRHPSHILDGGDIIPVPPADGLPGDYMNPSGGGDGSVSITENQNFSGVSGEDREVARRGIAAVRHLKLVDDAAVEGK